MSLDAGTSFVPQDGGQSSRVIGAETIGDECTAACGSADERKCSSETEDCPLCLVDPRHFQVAYCTKSCTDTDCPVGWGCEDIKTFGSFEIQEVTRGCVAMPPACGDGIVQLGEVCEEDDPQLGACVDCSGYAGVCGDGTVQAPEVCDGDTAEGYCLDSCGRLEAPHHSFQTERALLSLIDGNSSVGVSFTDPLPGSMGALPLNGDADGCGGVEVVEALPEGTRLAWTLCGSTGRARVSFVIPRIDTSLDISGAQIPEELRPSLTIYDTLGQLRFERTFEDLDSFKTITQPGAFDGEVSGRFEISDVGSPDELELVLWLALDYEVIHPVLP